MLPAFIVPEQTIEAKGAGEAIDIGDAAGQTLLLTLGLLDVVEQESFDLCISGSADGEEWSPKPLRAFPQKFYQGTSWVLLDLSGHAEVKYLRAEWTVNRWGVGSKTPMVKFYVHAEKFEESAAA